MQRLAVDQQRMTQGVTGFFVFEARSGAGDMGFGGLQEGQGAGFAFGLRVDALSDLAASLRASLRAWASPMAG